MQYKQLQKCLDYGYTCFYSPFVCVSVCACLYVVVCEGKIYRKLMESLKSIKITNG